MFSVANAQLLPNSAILLLWSSECSPEMVKNSADDIKTKCKEGSSLQLENVDRLKMSKFINTDSLV